MSRRVDAVLLCEDARQQDFLLRLLKKRGYSVRDIKVLSAPFGEGAGDQYVVSNYPAQVGGIKGFRSKSQHCKCCLVVGIDADNHSVDYRYRQLDEELRKTEELREDRIQPRQTEEPIAIFVPKWHIETWIDYLLNDSPVSEEEPSRLHGKTTSKQCKEAADSFFQFATQSTLPPDGPPSLQRGVEEMPRIPKAGS